MNITSFPVSAGELISRAFGSDIAFYGVQSAGICFNGIPETYPVQRSAGWNARCYRKEVSRFTTRGDARRELSNGIERASEEGRAPPLAELTVARMRK